MNRNRVIAGVAIAVVVALAGVGAATRGFGLLGPSSAKPLVLNGNVDIRQVDLGFRLGGRVLTCVT